MTAEEKIEAKQEIEELLKAMLAFAPSRNYLVQMLRMLPSDYSTISATYPEFFDDPAARSVLTGVFGVQIGERVEIGHGLANTLAQWSRTLTDLYADDNTPSKLKLLKSTFNLETPNPLEEWVEVRAKMACSEPRLGRTAKEILRNTIGRESMLLSDLGPKTGTDERTLRETVNLLEKLALVGRATDRTGAEGVSVNAGYSRTQQAVTLEGIQRAIGSEHA